jgi:hypothetical protein
MSCQNATPQPESKDDAIIRVTGYHRNDYNHFGIQFGDEYHRPIRSSTVLPFVSASTGNRGTMGGVPIEILQEICGLLDVQSCINFRQANRWAREVVSGMPQYRSVATHGLECLCAVLQTGLASAFTFTDLYDCLRTSACHRCQQQFGTHVYLPTMIRYCRSCLDDTTSTRACIINARRWERITGCNIESLGLPVLKFRSLAGRYNSHQKYIYIRKRQFMVDLTQIMKALRSVGLNDRVSAARSDMKAASYMPWIASVTMPHYNLATSTTMSGLACKGCAHGADRLRLLNLFQGHMMNKTYTRDQFVNHFQSCAQAQNLWYASNNGKLSIEHLVSKFVKNGGLAVKGSPLNYLYTSQR